MKKKIFLFLFLLGLFIRVDARVLTMKEIKEAFEKTDSYNEILKQYTESNESDTSTKMATEFVLNEENSTLTFTVIKNPKTDNIRTDLVVFTFDDDSVSYENKLEEIDQLKQIKSQPETNETAAESMMIVMGLAFSEVYRQAFVQNMTDVLTELTGEHEKFVSLKDRNKEFESSDSYNKNGYYYSYTFVNMDTYEIEEEQPDIETNSQVPFIGKYKISRDTDKIAALVANHGRYEGDLGSIDVVPSGLKPTVTVGVIKDVEASFNFSLPAEIKEDYYCSLYRSESINGPYKFILNDACRDVEYATSYVYDTNLKPGTTYYYKAKVRGGDTFSNVITVKTAGGTSVEQGNTTQGDPVKPTESGNITQVDPVKPTAETTSNLAKPTLTVENGNENSLVIKMDKYYSNQTYELERSTSSNKGFKKVVVLTESSYTNTGLTFGKKYYYRVKVTLDGKSEYSAVVGGTSVPNQVQNVRFVSAGMNNIKIAWDKAGYTGYEISRSENGTKWKRVKTITKNKTVTFNNTGLKTNKTYYYRVRSYKTVKGKKVYGPWSEVLTTKTAPAQPKTTVTNIEFKKFNITGNAKGAVSYQVYRSTKKNKGFKLVGTYTEGGYTDTDLSSGKTYYYKTKACNENGSCSGLSKKAVSKKVVLPKPSIVTLLSNTEKKVSVEVVLSKDAQGYEIERSTKNAKKGFKVVKTVENNTETVIDDETESKKKYYYRVRSFVVEDGKKKYSGYSIVKNITSK